jgi:hypothetical protein
MAQKFLEFAKPKSPPSSKKTTEQSIQVGTPEDPEIVKQRELKKARHDLFN